MARSYSEPLPFFLKSHLRYDFAMIGPRMISTGKKYKAFCHKCRWKFALYKDLQKTEEMYDWHMAKVHDPVREKEIFDRGPLPMPGPRSSLYDPS